MKNSIKKLILLVSTVIMVLGCSVIAFAADEAADTTGEATVITDESAAISSKAYAAAAVVGVAATAGAIGMALAISKSVESIARQPEAEGKIRTTMMLGLVFIETAIIYALIVAILLVFVL